MLGDGRSREASKRGVSERVDLAAGDVPEHWCGALAVRVAQVDMRAVFEQQLHDLIEEEEVVKKWKKIILWKTGLHKSSKALCTNFGVKDSENNAPLCCNCWARRRCVGVCCWPYWTRWHCHRTRRSAEQPPAMGKSCIGRLRRDSGSWACCSLQPRGGAACPPVSFWGPWWRRSSARGASGTYSSRPCPGSGSAGSPSAASGLWSGGPVKIVHWFVIVLHVV